MLSLDNLLQVLRFLDCQPDFTEAGMQQLSRRVSESGGMVLPAERQQELGAMAHELMTAAEARDSPGGSSPSETSKQGSPSRGESLRLELEEMRGDQPSQHRLALPGSNSPGADKMRQRLSNASQDREGEEGESSSRDSSPTAR